MMKRIKVVSKIKGKNIAKYVNHLDTIVSSNRLNKSIDIKTDVSSDEDIDLNINTAVSILKKEFLKCLSFDANISIVVNNATHGFGIFNKTMFGNNYILLSEEDFINPYIRELIQDYSNGTELVKWDNKDGNINITM